MRNFVKLDSNGSPLPADAADWVAVHDTSTGLIWSKDDVTDKSVTLKGAESACKKMDLLGAKDWRVPTVDELAMLADRSRYSPAIDTAFFPTCRSDWYWTRSPCAWSADGAWQVYFGLGFVGLGSRGLLARVRAVRSALPASQ